jgi:hypothetical protein
MLSVAADLERRSSNGLLIELGLNDAPQLDRKKHREGGEQRHTQEIAIEFADANGLPRASKAAEPHHERTRDLNRHNIRQREEASCDDSVATERAHRLDACRRQRRHHSRAQRDDHERGRARRKRERVHWRRRE